VRGSSSSILKENSAVCLKVGKTLGVGINLRVKVVNCLVTKTQNKALGPTQPIHPAQENRALFTISVIVLNKPRSSASANTSQKG